MFESLVISLFLTVVIEVSLAVIAKVRDKENLTTVLWVNVLTNPVVVFIANMISIIFENYFITMVSIYLLEILVLIVEGFLFKKYLKNVKMKPFLFALYLNGISFFIGEIINWILGA